MALFTTLKQWYLAFGAAAVAVFVFWFKARGDKIDVLEDTVEAQKKEAKVTADVVKHNTRKAVFEADNRVAAAEAESQDYKETHGEDPEKRFYTI